MPRRGDAEIQDFEIEEAEVFIFEIVVNFVEYSQVILLSGYCCPELTELNAL